MRRNDRTFRPADPLVPAPAWVWALTATLLLAISGGGLLFAMLT